VIEMLDVLIRGGLVVGDGYERELDVGIAGETIAFVGEADGSIEAGRVIDATGKIVMPGGVEAHAHIYEPMHRGWTGGEEVWLQSPEGATRAALHGGTTTVLSFAFMTVHVEKELYDVNAAIAERDAIFSARSYADYAFHPVLAGSVSDHTLGTLAEAIQGGTPTVKVFTTDLTTKQAGVMIDSGSLRDVLGVVATEGGILMSHSEDDGIIKRMEARLRREGRAQLPNVHLVHTALCEELAFRHVATMARDAGAPLYFVHVCGASALNVVAEARTAGQPVYGEVLHNMLCFSLDDYLEPDGAKYHIGMGLRPKEDCAALWAGLVDGGALSTLATDEYTTSFAVKMAGTDIESTPGGHVGIETRGMIGFSEGHRRRGMSLRRFVDVFSTNPAKLMGLYPRKGVIAPGSDADVAIWDPDVRRTITIDALHHDGDYSPWEGWDVEGWPVMTLLRGAIVVEDGELLSQPGSGRFVKRVLDPGLSRRPGV
jgi:dihydropyrimidinase